MAWFRDSTASLSPDSTASTMQWAMWSLRITRPVLFSYRFYNQDLTTGSLLIEIGGHGNNLNEALYAGQLAANGLVQALLGPDT